MKLPRPKMHILDVSDPLLSFHDLVMRCGVVLKNAEVKYSVASDMRDDVLILRYECRDCRNAGPSIPAAHKHYEYGLVEGEEEKQYQPEAADSITLGQGAVT